MGSVKIVSDLNIELDEAESLSYRFKKRLDGFSNLKQKIMFINASLRKIKEIESFTTKSEYEKI